MNSEAFKVMCSEGSISTTVIKGKAVDIEIKGKPAILVTTATANPKAEILNRFNLISLDETEEQTKRIMEKQGKRSEKGYSEEYDTIITESLSFLKRVNIKIPFGSKLSHFFPANILRMRRDFERFLNLIKSSVALHQKQRKQDEEGYYIAEKEDYELARNLIITIQTNSMIGLPHRLKKAYDCCNNLSTKKGLFIDNIEGFTAKEIHANFPFVSERMWRDYLDNLCEFKLLSAKLGEREGIKQKVTIYSSQSLIKINLPLFSDIFPDIQNISKVSIVSKVSKVTKVSKVKEKDITMETIETNEDGNTISKKNNELDKQLLKLKKTSFGVCGYCGEKQDLQYKDGEGHHLCQKCANDIRQQDKEGLL
ncbi:MAG: hypothetical protein KKA79_03695 [Nanoarchaeota archaeon]|nr:hypothetical protein [Nanoarchaeota archaeon]